MSTERRPILAAGEWASPGEGIPVRDPWTGETFAQVAGATGAEVEAAMQGAVEAFEETRRLAPFERAAILAKAASGIRALAEDLARTIVRESGKPIRDARGEVARAAVTFETAAEEAKRIGGEVIPLDGAPQGRGKVALTRRFPIGPVLGITPFNFPLNLPAHKVAPAIAAGNPIVLKPSPRTPLSALALARIVLEAGWPPAALSVLPLDAEGTQRLARDERFRLLTFTGSAPVGWNLKTIAGRKRVALELGGNAALLVHRDADLPRAAERCASGAFGLAGQSCISVQRVFVHRPVRDPFLESYLARARALRIGDPSDEATDLGPMIDDEAAARAEAWVAEAVEGGARTLLREPRRRTPGGALSLFPPTVLEGAPPQSKVSCEEVFAPVVVVETYDDLEAAIREVNRSPYGLQAGIFTRDLAAAWRAFEAIEAGAVLVNEVPTFRADPMPYGGTKASGLGREGPRFAIEDHTEERLLVLDLG